MKYSFKRPRCYKAPGQQAHRTEKIGSGYPQIAKKSPFKCNPENLHIDKASKTHYGLLPQSREHRAINDQKVSFMDKMRMKSTKHLRRHSTSKFPPPSGASKPELLIRLRKSQLLSDGDDYDDEVDSGRDESHTPRSAAVKSRNK